MSTTQPNVLAELAEQTNRYASLFVYGTLRPGHSNYNAFFKGYTVAEARAQVQGQIYFVGSILSYPVSYFGGEGRIIGDVLFFDSKNEEAMKRLRNADRMEVGAGYRMVKVEATLPHGLKLEVLSWEHTRSGRVGRRIESGDWASEVGTYRVGYSS